MSSSERLRLDLTLVLPRVDEAEDRCVARLTDALSGRPGIEGAQIVGGNSDSPPRCVHYEPNQDPLRRVRELVQSVGAQRASRYAHLVFRINGRLHARSARRVSEGLRNVPGVFEADLAASGALRIEYDSSTVLKQTLLHIVPSFGLACHATLERPSVRKASAEPAVDGGANGHDHARKGEAA